MSDISHLVQSVEAGREGHIRATDQKSRSRKHLKSLIDILEENLREKRIELWQNEIQRERMVREYGQLRDMQHSLVMAVLVGRADGLDDLEARSGAEAAGTHIEAVALDTAANDAARSPDGASENGSGETGSGENRSGENGSGENESGEKESARNGVDNSSDLRTGLRRIIKKTHAPRTTAGEHA